MSSIEYRENKAGPVWRVRYRYRGANRAMTFARLEDAEGWREMLEWFGPEKALQLARPEPPDLSIFGDQIEPPRELHVREAFVGPCVYLLWHRGVGDRKPAYVGATGNVLRRLGRHIEQKAGQFDRVTYIRCSDEDVMWRVESHLIAHYRPWLNIRIPSAS